jgi:hypothetical protein
MDKFIREQGLRDVKDNKKDEAGMNIELNSFSPYDSVSLLHLATCLIFRDMKNRGMSVPDLPPIDEYDDQL